MNICNISLAEPSIGGHPVHDHIKRFFFRSFVGQGKVNLNKADIGMTM